MTVNTIFDVANRLASLNRLCPALYHVCPTLGGYRRLYRPGMEGMRWGARGVGRAAGSEAHVPHCPALRGEGRGDVCVDPNCNR